jgi:HPt (histidine-containing phosphotransfer) domain-containing protein
MIRPAPNVCYFSGLASDPELADLVALFVTELPARLDEMRAAHGRGQWELLRGLAHQLKGAGGSYGFPQLTSAAAELECAARDRDAGRMVAALQSLTEVASRVRGGIPS